MPPASLSDQPVQAVRAAVPQPPASSTPPVGAGFGVSRFGCLGVGSGTRPQLRLGAGTTNRLSVTSSSRSAARPSLPPGSELIRRQVHDEFPTLAADPGAIDTAKKSRCQATRMRVEASLSAPFGRSDTVRTAVAAYSCTAKLREPSAGT